MACQLKSRLLAPGSLPKNTNAVELMAPTYHPVKAFVGNSVKIINNIGVTGIGDTRWNAGNYESWNSTAWVVIGP